MKTDIIILTKLKDGKFFKSIESLSRYDTEQNNNYIIGYTGNSDDEEKSIYDFMKQKTNHFVIKRLEYNFAKNNNYLVNTYSLTDTLLFVNDDVEIKTDAVNYCREILNSNESIGTVGIKLLYPDNTVQHLGQMMVIDNKTKSMIGVSHFGLKKDDIQARDFAVFGNTGAFCMMRRSDFLLAGEFDEKCNICFEDVILNMAMLKNKKVNICCASQYGIHHESITRGKNSFDKSDIRRMNDFYNENKEIILAFKKIMPNTIQEV